MLALLLLLQSQTRPVGPAAADTLPVRAVSRPPAAGEAPDSTRIGAPQVRLGAGQGSARVWLVRAADSVYIAALIEDSTPNPADAFVVSLNTGSERTGRPGHADFQWEFRRTLDSSVVYRGKEGRWEPPRDDPDWRLGAARSGGGWTVASADGPRRWSVVLQLDPGWLDGVAGSAPAIAFRVSDDRSREWQSWPTPAAGARAVSVEGAPSLWVPLRP